MTGMLGGREALWVNAFTARPEGGNPCLVIFDAGDVPRETRIAFTLATGFSECAFLQPSDKADFGVRYYTANDEIKFAGHPTIATCTALDHAGLLEGRERFTLEVGSGVIPIEVTRGDGPPGFTMTQAQPVFGERYEPGFIAAMFGLTAADIVGRPQVVSTGTAFCIAEVAGLDALRRASLDAAAWTAAEAEYGPHFEPFLVVREGVDGGDTFSRLLLGPPLPPEDPFTGSATGCMASYLFAEGRIGKRFVAEQGHWMGRPGRAVAEIVEDGGTITGVRLTGEGVVLMAGRV